MKNIHNKSKLHIALVATAAITGISIMFHWSWNAVIPEITSLESLAFKESFALLILITIISGILNWGFGRGRHWKKTELLESNNETL